MKNIYKEALDVQDACNSSGVIHSLSRAMEEIWKEAREKNLGTEYVNQHPVVKMFLTKLCDLAKMDSEFPSKAYDECYEKSLEAIPAPAEPNEQSTARQ